MLRHPRQVCNQFLDLAKHVSWVCESCRSTVQSTIQKLRAEVSTLSSNVVQLQADMAQLQSDIRQNQHTTTAAPHSLSPSDDLPVPVTVPTVEVERVIENINRRKSNVIVSGLQEDSNVSDTETFQQLCESYLQCKPFVVNSRRIGQRSPGKPQRLLVRLRDEQSATALLCSSRRLHSDDNETISKTVFINPDLTPAAAKLAFEERQKRRQQKSAKSQSDRDTSDHCYFYWYRC